MNFTLQCEECFMNPYQGGYDIIIRGKMYFGEQVGNILYLYKGEDEVGYIDLATYTLYEMDMNGDPIQQEYYYEGRVYIRNNDQLLNKNGDVIAYQDTTSSETSSSETSYWVWLVDYTKEGKQL